MYACNTPRGVLTNNNNNARTGEYFDAKLSPSNVSAATFGKVHTWLLNGQVWAQPLYVHGLTLRDGSSHNVVYAATTRNVIDAFDADTFAKMWEKNLGDGHAIPAVPYYADGICNGHKRNDFPWIGILSTPAIDLNSSIIYVVTSVGDADRKTKRYKYQLYALDLGTGSIVSGPVDVEAPGFDPLAQLNRPGVLLSNGKVYLAFGARCESNDFTDPAGTGIFGGTVKRAYHGWIFSFDAHTLQHLATFNVTPGGHDGGIWQAGRGLAADQAGNVYFVTGNGDVDFKGLKLGESIVRLDQNLQNPDWFTPGPKGAFNPDDYRCLNGVDLDLGASGPLLSLSDNRNLTANRILGGGKGGIFYLLSTASVGGSNHFTALDELIATHSPEWFGSACVAGTLVKSGGTDTHHIHGGPVLWNRSGEKLIYNWGENDSLKLFKRESDRFVAKRNGEDPATPVAKSKMVAPSGMPGGILSISHSADPTSGLVWATLPKTDASPGHVAEGMLIAFQASPVPCVGGSCQPSVQDLPLLWHSDMNGSRDSLGLFAKFSPPTIADGKVFVASFGDPNYKDAESRPGFLHEYSFCPC